MYAYLSAAVIALVPPGPVTVTSTWPGAPGGAFAVIDVPLLTTNEVALEAPNATAVAPVKLLPVMVTLVPPASGPWLGLTALTVGDADVAGTTAKPNGWVL